MIDEALRAKIDNASYEQLLSWWRFSPAGSPMFVGETGAYFSNVMASKRDALRDGEHAATSKRIGWGNENGPG